MKKIKLKKLAAMLITVLMTCGLLTTVFAANSSLPPDTGSLTIHKYLMDDLTQAGQPNDGNETTVPTGAKPLNGIEFKVYQVEIPTSGADQGKVPVQGDYVLDSMTAPTTLTSGGVTFNLGTGVAQTTAGTGASEGTAKFDNLAKGYYLVVEQPNQAVASPAQPFVVAVPMTQTNAAGNNGWIQNVHVYPKNESMRAEKTPSVTSVNLGEKVTWSIIASIPADIADAKALKVVDNMDEALVFVNDSVKVEGLTAKDGSGTIIPQATNWVANVDTNNSFTVNFKDKVNTAPDGLAELAKYKFVKITFDTTVNNKILERATRTVVNQATVEYTNRFDQNKTNLTAESKVHTGTIKIKNMDANTGSPVEGAEFQIATSEANAKAGNYLKKTADGKIVDVGDPAYAGATAWIATTVKGTRDRATSAYASFAGLKDYTEGTGGAKTYLSYWLVKTKAPAGYNLLSAPVKVDFTELNSTELTLYTVNVEIKNTTAFTLPQTGGTGTILFVAGGILLIGLAAILFIVFRKKAHTK